MKAGIRGYHTINLTLDEWIFLFHISNDLSIPEVYLSFAVGISGPAMSSKFKTISRSPTCLKYKLDKDKWRGNLRYLIHKLSSYTGKMKPRKISKVLMDQHEVQRIIFDSEGGVDFANKLKELYGVETRLKESKSRAVFNEIYHNRHQLNNGHNNIHTTSSTEQKDIIPNPVLNYIKVIVELAESQYDSSIKRLSAQLMGSVDMTERLLLVKKIQLMRINRTSEIYNLTIENLMDKMNDFTRDNNTIKTLEKEISALEGLLALKEILNGKV